MLPGPGRRSAPWPAKGAGVQQRGYPGGLQTADDAEINGLTNVPDTREFRNLLTQSVDWLGLSRAQSNEALQEIDLLAETIREELN